MPEPLEFRRGRGRSAVRIRLLYMGDHPVLLVGGGQEHLGAVGLAEPRPSLSDPEQTSASTSLLVRIGHKEDLMAREIAGELASWCRQPVLVCCGIHYDLLESKEIERVTQNYRILIKTLKKRMNRST
jgi:hypothetical protein